MLWCSMNYEGLKIRSRRFGGYSDSKISPPMGFAPPPPTAIILKNNDVMHTKIHQVTKSHRHAHFYMKPFDFDRSMVFQAFHKVLNHSN